MDRFIEQSNALLAARPDTTRVSTRFTHKKVKEGGERAVPGATPAVAIIKTYDPVSKAVYKYRLSRVNELSRILACLGPNFVEIGTSRKRGFASIMSGVEPVDEPEAPSEPPSKEAKKEPEAKAATKAPAKSKKKRGKK